MDSEVIEGEPSSDRKVTVNGRDWRVRVKISEEFPTTAPVNGTPDVVPSAIGILVSVAALDESGVVAADSDGRLLIFDPRVLTFQGQAITREGFDPEAEIIDLIEQQIGEAERQLEGRARLTAALNAWSAAPE